MWYISIFLLYDSKTQNWSEYFTASWWCGISLLIWFGLITCPHRSRPWCTTAHRRRDSSLTACSQLLTCRSVFIRSTWLFLIFYLHFTLLKLAAPQWISQFRHLLGVVKKPVLHILSMSPLYCCADAHICDQAPESSFI